jgi:hypothetical protein
MPSIPVVVTLVAVPQSFEISDALIARAAQALPRAVRFERLAEGAADLFFEGDIAQTALAGERLMATLAGQSIDAIIRPATQRRKRLLLADMDSTLIEQECIDELAARAGLGAQVAAITECAMRGEIAFEPALRGFSPRGFRRLRREPAGKQIDYSKASATKRASPAALETSSSADFFPDFLTESIALFKSSGSLTAT